MDASQPFQKRNVIGVLFLVAGTCIGGGMLALPVATGLSGFVPSLVAMVVAWFFMTYTALLLLEVNLWLAEGAHVITMSSRMLGPIGKIISALLYIFISYASLIAYTSGGGSLITLAAKTFFDFAVDKWIGCLIFAALFGFVVDLGLRTIGRINTILCIGMIGAYIALVALGSGDVKLELLTRSQWNISFLALPLLLTSFSFQTMVPSLTPYLRAHPKWLRIAVIAGTTLALVVYVIWEWLVLGTVPVNGAEGLAIALAHGEAATYSLRNAVGNPWVSIIAEYFAFFALVTSFLGISLGLFDFLADGLKIKKAGKGKFLLGFLVLAPSLFFAVTYPRAFLEALDASGGFGDAILNGMIPVLMVWMGRYYKNMGTGYRTPGGKGALVITFLFFLSVLLIEIFAKINYFKLI